MEWSPRISRNSPGFARNSPGLARNSSGFARNSPEKLTEEQLKQATAGPNENLLKMIDKMIKS